MNAGDYLNEARAIIQDRGMDYGHPTDNMSRTARLWSAYLEMPIEDYQVAMCLALVKVARSMESGKVDNYIDGAIRCYIRTTEKRGERTLCLI